MVSRHVRRWHLLLPLMAVGMLSGCATRDEDMLRFLREHEHEVSAIEYRVGVPDAIAISAPRVEEIDGQERRIQPDGKVTLDLLGEVKIVGMTAKEIAAKLQVLLSRYYLDPKVSVRVVEYASKKYYVTGVTSRKGAVPYTGRDTLIDAVMGAGLNFMCWTSQIEVIRPAPNAHEPIVIRVDVDEMLDSGDWSKNILLEPDDVVHIPPTPLAWLGLRLQELLFPVQPVRDAYMTPADFMGNQRVYEEERYGQRTAPR
jgi:protein involved in polysaccharide export with SLBB domain